jgi:hypothetical protein
MEVVLKKPHFQGRIKLVSRPLYLTKKEVCPMKDMNSLAHTTSRKQRDGSSASLNADLIITSKITLVNTLSFLGSVFTS